MNLSTEEILSLKEAAEFLRSSKSWLYKLVQKQKERESNICPPFFRMGNRIFFKRSELLLWVAEKEGDDS